MVTVSELDDEAPDTEAPNDDSVSEPLPAVAPATIRQMTREHWQAVRRIYADGLTSGNASFELKPPGWDEFQQSHLADHQLVAIDDAKVVGWAALSPVSERCAYAGVAESSVYVAARSRGRGVGSQILSQLVWRAEMAGIWTVQAGIFPENAASIALHHRCGFRTVGVRERLGQRNGVWRDVLLLERRSGLVT